MIDDAGEVMKYYVDGVMVKEQNLIRSLGLPKLLGVPEDKGYVGNLNIGGYVDVDGKTVSRGIQGAIDEIAVYSKALSDSRNAAVGFDRKFCRNYGSNSHHNQYTRCSDHNQSDNG